MNRSEREVVSQDCGMEAFGAEDLRLPQLKLRQEETERAERVPPGSWFVTSDPEGHALSRGVVLLEMRKERSLLLARDSLAPRRAQVARIARETGVTVPIDHEGPVCFSRDRVTPADHSGTWALSERCATCPMARWRTVDGRRTQDCAESYRLLLWDEGEETACVYHARGAAIPVVKDLLTSLRVATRRLGVPACGFRMGLSARLVRSLEGSYYLPSFTRPYPHSDPLVWRRYAEIHEACTPGTNPVVNGGAT